VKRKKGLPQKRGESNEMFFSGSEGSELGPGNAESRRRDKKYLGRKRKEGHVLPVQLSFTGLKGVRASATR